MTDEAKLNELVNAAQDGSAVAPQVDPSVAELVRMQLKDEYEKKLEHSLKSQSGRIEKAVREKVEQEYAEKSALVDKTLEEQVKLLSEQKSNLTGKLESLATVLDEYNNVFESEIKEIREKAAKQDADGLKELDELLEGEPPQKKVKLYKVFYKKMEKKTQQFSTPKPPAKQKSGSSHDVPSWEKHINKKK